MKKDKERGDTGERGKERGGELVVTVRRKRTGGEKGGGVLEGWKCVDRVTQRGKEVPSKSMTLIGTGEETSVCVHAWLCTSGCIAMCILRACRKLLLTWLAGCGCDIN